MRRQGKESALMQLTPLAPEDVNVLIQAINYGKQNDVYWHLDESTGQFSYLTIKQAHEIEYDSEHLCSNGPCDRFVFWYRYAVADTALNILRIFRRMGGEYARVKLQTIIEEAFDPFNKATNQECEYDLYD